MGVSYYFRFKDSDEVAQLDTRSETFKILKQKGFLKLISEEENLSIREVLINENDSKNIDPILFKTTCDKLLAFAKQKSKKSKDKIFFRSEHNTWLSPGTFTNRESIEIDGKHCWISGDGEYSSQPQKNGFFNVRSTDGEIDYWKEVSPEFVLGNTKFTTMISNCYENVKQEISEILPFLELAIKNNKMIRMDIC